MRRSMRLPIVALLASLTLAGCTEYGPKQTIGGLGGAAAGGLLGSQIGHGSGRLWATGIGAVLGAFAGSEIGASLDRADQAYAEQAASQAYMAPVGQPIQWNNPQSGNYGQIVTTRDGTAANGAYCREYQQTVTVGGRSQQAYGQACRQPDGSWQIVQ